MLVHKTTVGFVTQVFDEETQRFIRQDFIAGDEVAYETSEGEPIMDEERTGVTDIYLPFDMKQPQELNAEQKLKELVELLPNLYDSMVEEVAQEIQDFLNTNC